MTLQGHVEDAFGFVLVDVLPQPAQPLAGVEYHRAGGLLDLAGEDLEKGGLARAVGADEAVAVAGGEAQRDVLEQHLAAEGHAQLAGGDHQESLGRGLIAGGDGMARRREGRADGKRKRDEGRGGMLAFLLTPDAKR